VRQWQYDGAPMQLHPGDLGWFWRFGATATAAALRTWRRDGRTLAVGLLDDAKLLRLTIAPDAQRDEELAAGIARTSRYARVFGSAIACNCGSRWPGASHHRSPDWTGHPEESPAGLRRPRTDSPARQARPNGNRMTGPLRKDTLGRRARSVHGQYCPFSAAPPPSCGSTGPPGPGRQPDAPSLVHPDGVAHRENRPDIAHELRQIPVGLAQSFLNASEPGTLN
jgi:hypothetical protein